MKNILFIICAGFVSITGHAQPVKKQAKENSSKMQLGFLIGENLTYPVGTYNNSGRENAGVTTQRLGFAAAIHYQFNFSSHWALHTEFVYQRKRDYFYRAYNYSIGDNIKLSIPVLVRYNANRFFAEIGPYIGYDYGFAYYYCQFIGDPLTHSNTYKSSHIHLYEGACLGIGYHVINKESFSFPINLRNDQEIIVHKKFLKEHPYNTTMLLIEFNCKL